MMPDPAGTLSLSGEVLTGRERLAPYGTDMSGYSVRPRIAAIPIDERDVAEIIRFARKNDCPVTPRGAGSNQSGSAVGGGIVVLLGKMNRICSITPGKAVVEPGIVHSALDAKAREIGWCIPYDPTSRAFSMIGGNLATGAGGIRGVKYGSVDRWVRSVRFFDTAHGPIDTSTGLPDDLKAGIEDIRDRIRLDREMTDLLGRRRRIKSSSGYNLSSFLDHTDPKDIVTHLFPGSVGTLGIATRIEIGLMKIPATRLLYLLYFSSVAGACAQAAGILAMNPSALELMDRQGVALLREVPGTRPPPESEAVLMVEFDEDTGTATRLMEKFLIDSRIPRDLVTDQGSQEAFWKIREAMLLRIKRTYETPDRRFLSFADDLGVPVGDLPRFVRDLDAIFRRENIFFVIYGHAGEGNLHVRPLIPRDGWERRLERLSRECFRAALRYGGTISGEHGAGRNRSKYLRDEWGERGCIYFREIKDLFDPAGLLNPGTIFGAGDISRNLVF